MKTQKQYDANGFRETRATWHLQLGLGLVLLALFALPASAQSAGEANSVPTEADETVVAETAPTPPATARRRIIEAPITRSWGLKIVDAIKYPFHVFGNALNKGARRVEEDHLMERASDMQALVISKGYEPLFGATGGSSGVGFGVNYVPKKGIPKGWRLEFPIQYSLNQSAHLGAHLTVPVASHNKVVVRTGVDYLDLTRQDFFGFGSQSSEQNRANYRLEKREAFLALEARPHPKLAVGFPLRLSNSGISEGSNNRFPDLQQQFDTSQIPGSTGANLVSFGSYLDWDYRDNASLPRAGGRIRIDASYFQDTGRQDFRFMRYGLDAVQYLPLDDEHGFVGRALIIVNDEQGRSAVPLSEKGVLGGGNSLRGFRPFRFQDDNALLLTLEYRWMVWQFADMILFFDEGQVAPEPGDFSVSGLRSSRGAGFRFRQGEAQFLRIDVAHSLEGWRWYLNYQIQI